MSIPQGSLRANETCNVFLKAIVHGKFEFPKNTKLVSGVYAIAMTRELLQPATIEIEHCVDLKTMDQCNCLGFVRAYCTQKSLPYTFENIPGGSFYPGTTTGKMSLTKFSMLAIVQMSNTTDEDTPADCDDGHVYFAHLWQYHIRPLEWFVVFLVTKRLQITSEVLQKKFNARITLLL